MVELPGIVLAELGHLPTLETVTLHEPGPDEVRVRVVASGICHTDLGYVHYARACPVILGHEGAGVVEQVGERVSHVRPGDHVVVNWQPKCGQCRRCLAGRRDLCENIQGTASPRVFWRGQPLHVMLNAGTFCPQVVVPAAGAVPIRADMPLDKAALLGCGVATGVGAALFTAKVQPGDDVVVIGVGGVGLNIIQGARLAPLTYWAVGGVPYPYTLNLSSEYIEPLLVASFEQFGAMGFRVIVALPVTLGWTTP